MDEILSMAGIRAGYGPNDVLHETSLQIRSGEIVTLLGGNGAGKTTTLGILSGMITPRQGTVRWMGQDITSWNTAKRLSEGLVLCPEARRIFPRLTVEENLLAGAWMRPHREAAQGIEEAFQRFSILKDRRRQLGGTLSGGEQQMLAIARSLMARPRLLMLDEPSLGLAPLIVERIFRILQEINAAGTPVLLVEQNARQALGIANRGYVLATGRIVQEGTGRDLLESDEVRKAYLGGD